MGNKSSVVFIYLFGVFCMRFLVMLGSLVCIFASACTNPATPVKLSEELLAGTSSKTWNTTSLISSSGSESIGITIESNTYIFKRDGSYTNTFVLKGSFAMYSNSGTWKLENKQLALTIGTNGDIVNIDELTETSFKFSSASEGVKYTLKAR